MTNLKIVYLDPKTLAPHPRNSRVHSEEQVDLLAGSIDAFDFIKPVILGPGKQIIAGHGAVRAAVKRGLQSIPTVTLSHLTEEERRAFMIADNRLAELSSFDMEILALELEELSAVDMSFEPTVLGFEPAEMDVIIEARHKPATESDPADKPVLASEVEQVAQLGDFWLLGRHRLFVGSALDGVSYQALLGTERVQMVISDPPWNVPVMGHVSGMGKIKHDEFVMASGEMTSEEFGRFLRTTMEHLIEFSVSGSMHFLFIDWRGLKTLLTAGEAYTELKNICCWVKSNGGGMGSLYRSQHELIAVFKSGKDKHKNLVQLGRFGRNRTNVWMMPGMAGFQKGRMEKLAMHPTVKPVGLIADAILDCSQRGDLILDPFGGSGTTALAAERTGRIAALMELDPHYADVTLRRFCDATGIEPVNAFTGQIVRRRQA